MSHPRIHSHSCPYLTGALMTRLDRDVLMLSDGMSAFCLMGVSAFGFGRLAVSLVLWVSAGTWCLVLGVSAGTVTLSSFLWKQFLQ